MTQQTKAPVDSITIPLTPLRSSSAASGSPEPIVDITICCPPSNSTVGLNFDVRGTFSFPCIGVLSCTLINPQPLLNQAANSLSNDIGTWTATFVNVPPDTYDLVVVGAGTNPPQTDARYSITVRADGATDCQCVDLSPAKNPSGSAMVQDITFQGTFPEKNGRRKPTMLAGRVPAALTVGGLLGGSNKTVKCNLGSIQMADQMIKYKGHRWFADFSDVPVGNYTLEVVAADGTSASQEIRIAATKEGC